MRPPCAAPSAGTCDLAEIEAVLVRRRLIVEHFDKLIAEKGADAVLF